MQEHKMKLMPEYFDYIKNGTKRIEVRLNDEKRQLIHIGDYITFEKVSDEPEYLKVQVTDLYYESSFSNLLDKHDMVLFASNNITKEELLNILDQFYTKEEQDKYGVVGIRIEIKSN